MYSFQQMVFAHSKQGATDGVWVFLPVRWSVHVDISPYLFLLCFLPLFE